MLTARIVRLVMVVALSRVGTHAYERLKAYIQSKFVFGSEEAFGALIFVDELTHEARVDVISPMRTWFCLFDHFYRVLFLVYL